MPLGLEAERRIESTPALVASMVRKKIQYKGRFREMVMRSAITLRQLTFAISGGVVAAATASLPGKAGRRDELGLPLLLAARCGSDFEQLHRYWSA